jgi:isoquinoline 1-oxidoreductase/isoquinoline 1-oxidoreductase beta subunit
VLEGEFFVPYLAHATMEPMNATVHLTDAHCDIWAPVQAPDLARQVACDMTGLSRSQVRVHTTFIGGGFGRRALNDFIAEAVAIAMRTDGPIKLIWTREDDTRHGYFRSATTHQLSAALDDDGRITAWRHRLVAPLLTQHILPPALAALAPEWLPDGWVAGAANLAIRIQSAWFGPVQAWDGAATLPYAIDHVRVEVAEWDPGVPVSIWRSVGNSYNAFVVETFIDELARAAGTDPVEFRRQYLADQPRHLAVLDRVAAEAGWGRPGPGRHHGVAIHECFGSVVGQVVEVSVGEDAAIRVHRVCCVVDCGIAVNPDVVRAQLEGGILYGLTAALYGSIDIRDGQVQQSNFHDYRMLTLADAPGIDVHIIESDADPGGIGETGTPPIAPAVANAVFAATGRRLRELPLKLQASNG